MTFKERVETVREYKTWIEEQNNKHDFNLCDNHETFLAFLETKGLLQEQRPKGKWVLEGMFYHCSCCGQDLDQVPDNYCANCGAFMEDDTQ